MEVMDKEVKHAMAGVAGAHGLLTLWGTAARRVSQEQGVPSAVAIEWVCRSSEAVRMVQVLAPLLLVSYCSPLPGTCMVRHLWLHQHRSPERDAALNILRCRWLFPQCHAKRDELPLEAVGDKGQYGCVAGLSHNTCKVVPLQSALRSLDSL